MRKNNVPLLNVFVVSDDQDSGILAEGSDDLSQTSECVGLERGTRRDSAASRTSSLDRREVSERFETGQEVRDLRLVKLSGVSDKTIGVTLARVPLSNVKCDGYKVITLHRGGWAER